MPKQRLSRARRASHSSRRQHHKNIKDIRFIGIALSGGKNDKTTITELSYFPGHTKLFVNDIHDKIESDELQSGDEKLLALLHERKKTTQLIAIDAPLQLPTCFIHKCGGIHKCKAATTKWNWLQFKKHKKKKKNLKLFTPYTERCVERLINYELEEFYEIPEALGANKAPITARSIYLKNKIKTPIVEVFPKLSIHRIGAKLQIPKEDLKNYRHAALGVESRMLILDVLISSGILFIYEQDVQKFIDSSYAFDSLLAAMTAYLSYQKQCEQPVKGFPLSEGWIHFPMLDFNF